MSNMPRSISALAFGAFLAASAAAADDVPRLASETLDGRIVTAGGEIFDSWSEYLESDFFRENDLRCGTPLGQTAEAGSVGSPSDCTYNLTNPDPIYDSSVVRYRIPVVVHVIQNTAGSGFISAALAQSQIDILNEDFLALAGTPGGLGNDVQVEFYLATEDPSGNPTTGITYSTNNTWFNDGGTYYNSLAWDTNRYTNIYTNTAGGNLGYVPDLPQGGIAGSNSDRIVILWSAFGRDAPTGPPYDQGRTATHEVGHYLGLYHPFDNGCGTVAACYTTGDRICDTPRESNPSFGCPAGKATCGDDDAQENYMDYSDDTCMTEFTLEQERRMRCSLEGYRPDLFEVVNQLCGNEQLDSGEQCDDGNTTPGDGCDFICRIEAPPSEVSAPASPSPLIFTDKKTMRWEPPEPSRSVTFNLYRGVLSDVALGDYGDCFSPGLTSPVAMVPFKPPVGRTWSFLVTGENSYGEGTLGETSAGASRVNVAPCP